MTAEVVNEVYVSYPRKTNGPKSGINDVPISYF